MHAARGEGVLGQAQTHVAGMEAPQARGGLHEQGAVFYARHDRANSLTLRQRHPHRLAGEGRDSSPTPTSAQRSPRAENTPSTLASSASTAPSMRFRCGGTPAAAEVRRRLVDAAAHVVQVTLMPMPITTARELRPRPALRSACCGQLVLAPEHVVEPFTVASATPKLRSARTNATLTARLSPFLPETQQREGERVAQTGVPAAAVPPAASGLQLRCHRQAAGRAGLCLCQKQTVGRFRRIHNVDLGLTLFKVHGRGDRLVTPIDGSTPSRSSIISARIETRSKSTLSIRRNLPTVCFWQRQRPARPAAWRWQRSWDSGPRAARPRLAHRSGQRAHLLSAVAFPAGRGWAAWAESGGQRGVGARAAQLGGGGGDREVAERRVCASTSWPAC